MASYVNSGQENGTYNQSYQASPSSAPYKAEEWQPAPNFSHVEAGLATTNTPPPSAFDKAGEWQPAPNYSHVEAGLATTNTPPVNFAFTERSLRLGFIRKVYGILSAQLLVTFGFVTLCVLEKNIQRFVQDNIWVMLVCWGVIFTTVILLAFCRNVARTSPGNYVILSLLTLAMSWAVGTTASFFRAEEVIMAVGITLAMTVGLTIFSFQTRYDFTYKHGFLLIALIALIFFGMFAGIFHDRVLGVFYGFLGALVFGAFLVVDTQFMLGGQHKYSYSPEDYIFAALNLYLDIINIFLYVLQIFASSR